MSCYGIVSRLIRVEVAWWLSLSKLCLVGFRNCNNGVKEKQGGEKRKSRSTARRFYIYFGLFQPCAFFKSIRIYLFYALDMVNNFPSAHAPGHLKDGAVQGHNRHDHKVARIATGKLLRPDQVNNYKRCEAVPL